MSLLSTSELIKKYGLNAKKSLGQNFILDKNFTDKIARAAGDLTDFTVLEIGPGLGSLTRSILDAGVKKLIAVEKDQRCLQALEELRDFYGSRLQIIEGDALKIDEMKIFQTPQQVRGDKSQIEDGKLKFKIIANLPYNIGTLLLFKWLKIAPQISSMHLMLQKEVAQRIVAKTGENHYGRLAVMVNFLCQTKIVFNVSPSVFTPPPKVTSAIIEIIPRAKPLVDVEFAKLEKVVAVAFNQRRKMLKSSLKSIFPNAEEVLKDSAINPELRAENLTIEEFCKLAQRLK
ncbi:MAG: 16S rRNA (adenine(1518)-N(6)/adenine(1519)-N(6))-dimethyltransferase RsmA [Rickettsiales bacterium]|nr:16S rRNA (adenine(1518)-N(6)/adenine(1519)-N(6))-dimethyltransferase RsmA [Rickettsiales bacterium]